MKYKRPILVLATIHLNIGFSLYYIVDFERNHKLLNLKNYSEWSSVKVTVIRLKLMTIKHSFFYYVHKQ